MNAHATDGLQELHHQAWQVVRLSFVKTQYIMVSKSIKSCHSAEKSVPRKVPRTGEGLLPQRDVQLGHRTAAPNSNGPNCITRPTSCVALVVHHSLLPNRCQQATTEQRQELQVASPSRR